MMIHQTPNGTATFGYLSAVESAEHGFFGGYLLGEQIAGTLLATAQTKPKIILTDQPSVLCHRAKSDVPIVCLVPECSETGGGLPLLGGDGEVSGGVGGGARA